MITPIPMPVLDEFVEYADRLRRKITEGFGVPSQFIGQEQSFIFEGFRLLVSEDATVRRWVYPVEKFWSYEPSPETEKWCRFFGFGHEVTEPGCYQVGRTMMIHPLVWKALEARMDRERRTIDQIYEHAESGKHPRFYV